MSRHADPEKLRRAVAESARRNRDVADEMAAMFGGCDDPLHPLMATGDDQPFTDWLDFRERVCVPLVESEDEAVIQEAMRLYRQASPFYIALAIYMAGFDKAAERQARTDHVGQ